MPNLRTETFGGGDQTWLANTHAIGDAITATPDLTTFTKATHYPGGFLPSGTPVDCSDPKAIKPFADTAAALLGFIHFDAPVVNDSVAPCAVVVHALVKPERVPGNFTVPTTADTGGIIFVKGDA